jgi:hypothetical protein
MGAGTTDILQLHTNQALEAHMTGSLDQSQIDPPSETNTAAGRYDKLIEGGIATRFVRAGREIRADVPSGGQLPSAQRN